MRLRLLLPVFALLALVAVVVDEPDRRSVPMTPAAHTVRPAAVPAARRAARQELATELGARAVVSGDRSTGGLRVAMKLGGHLTAPSDRAPAAVALAYVRRHAAAFGIDAGDLKPAESERVGGTTYLRWTQSVRGVPTLDGDLRAVVDRRGRLVSIGGGARPDLAAADTTPAITKTDAVARAARATGGSAESRPDEARLVLASGRLAWHIVRRQDAGHVYDQLIDAHDGAELRRLNRVDAAVTTAKVFPNYPGAPVGGTQETVDFKGWLLHPDSPGGLRGRYARVWSDVDDDGQWAADEETAPGANGWEYARTPFVGPGCGAGGCTWNPTVKGSWTLNRPQAATQLFYLMNAYRDHMAAAPISFDEFGFGDPRGDDYVIGLAHVGANGAGEMPDDDHVNDANMYTPPDGQSPVMRMFLWAPTADGSERSNHAGDDPSVVFHEYQHAVSSRLVHDAMGWAALNLRQSGAINEALSDVYALDFLVDSGRLSDGPGADVRMGEHLDPHGVRTEPIDCAPDEGSTDCPGSIEAGAGGYTFADLGHVADSPEVHADSEIIAQTLWDARRALIAAHGAAEGVERFRAVLTGALRIVPAEPSFLDLRNAIMQADLLVSGGADYEPLFDAFRKRGMGWYASVVDADDVKPHEDFSGPPSATGSKLAGRITDAATGEGVEGLTVTVAGHATDTEYTPDHRGITDGDGRYEIAGVAPGTYEHVLVAGPGYEPTRIGDVAVTASGGTASAAVRRNWADVGAGAQVVDGGGGFCSGDRAFDGDELSGWHDQWDQRTVELELPAEVRVTSFSFDPAARVCRDEKGDTPTRMTIEVGRDGKSFSRAVDVELGRGYARHMTEVRPIAPIDGVRYVRLKLGGSAGSILGFSELRVFASPKVGPTAAFAYEPKLPEVRKPVRLDATGSAGGSSAIAGYAWDLDGDGEYETDSGRTPTVEHTFTSGGRKTVGLRVRNADGESDDLRRVLYVGRDVEIMDLGAVDPDNASRGIVSTRRGIVVGQSWTGGQSVKRAFRYDGGDMKALQPLYPGASATAYDATDDGLTVGFSDTDEANREHAVIWDRDGRPFDLGSAGGISQAIGINRNGDVVGFAEKTSGHPRAFLKPAGGPLTDIQELAGIEKDEHKDSLAAKINADGDVVGCLDLDLWRMTCGKAFLYSGGALALLPTLGGEKSNAIDIAADGTAVGWAFDLSGRAQAVRWPDAGTVTRLQTTSSTSQANSIEDQDGWIVGDMTMALGNTVPFVERGNGTEDLDALVEGTGWTLEHAESINTWKEVIGTGLHKGKRRAYQLNLGPCRVCVTDIAFEERDLPSGDWKDVGADGTVDGNTVRVTVKARNDDEQSHVVVPHVTDVNRDREILETPSAHTIALAPGQTKSFSFEWETTDLAWNDGKPDADHVVNVRLGVGRTVFTSRSNVLKIRPRPMVLVHGMLSNAATWAPYAELAKRANPDWTAHAVGDGYGSKVAMDTGDWGDLLGTPNSIYENAAIMDEYVEGVRALEDAQRIDLVAHSMGGLISRQWIHSFMPKSDEPLAAHLVQLGTPNMGSPCADEFDLDEVYELRPEIVAQFNGYVTDRKGVPFSVYVGDPMPFTCRGTEAGDSVVPVSSAKWKIADHEVHGTMHTDMTGSGSVFASFVVPRLSGTKAVPAALARAAAAAEEERPSTLTQVLPRRTASLAAGATLDVPVAVDGGARLDVTLLAAPYVRAQLLDPAGLAVAETSGAATLFRRLQADAPAPGEWTVRLTNGGDAPSQAVVTPQLADDPWQLDLRRGTPAADGSLPVVATVAVGDQRLRSVELSLAVRRRGGMAETVTLYDDGVHGDGAAADGCYAAAPKIEPGVVMLALRARARGTERTLETTADVPAGSGEGTGPVCPSAVGRNGEMWTHHIERTSEDAPFGWRTVPAGDPVPGLDYHVREAVVSRTGDRRATLGDDGLVVDGKVLRGGEASWPISDIDLSPDGSKLVYTKWCPDGDPEEPWDEHECEIAILDVASGAEQIVATGALQPAWSPDGQKIAFVRHLPDEKGTDCEENLYACPIPLDLFTMNPDGSGLKRLTTGVRYVEDPAWSPDGRRIAVSRWDSYNYEEDHGEDQDIWVVGRDGSGLENVIGDPDEGAADKQEHDPVWSPDGRYVAFLSERGEPQDRPWRRPVTNQVWRVRPDGTGLTRLTDTPSLKSGPPVWLALPYLLEPAAPVCEDGAARTQPGAGVRIQLSCTDDNGDPLTFTVVTPPAHGTVDAPDAAGAVRYTPAAGWEGADTFTFKATDGKADSNVATVTVTTAAPPPPAPTPTPTPTAPPVTPGGPVIGGGASGGGGSSGGGSSGGGTTKLPPSCPVGPSGTCIVETGCPSGGANCTGRLSAPGTAQRAIAVTARRGSSTLFAPARFSIRAGATKRVAIRLTARGRAQLKRTGRLVIRVRLEVRRDGALIQSQTRRMTLKRKGRTRR